MIKHYDIDDVARAFEPYLSNNNLRLDECKLESGSGYTAFARYAGNRIEVELIVDRGFPSVHYKAHDSNWKGIDYRATEPVDPLDLYADFIHQVEEPGTSAGR